MTLALVRAPVLHVENERSAEFEPSPLGERVEFDVKLTPAQASVVELIGEGLTYAQAGSILGLAESTVKFHVVTLIEQTGARNGCHLAVMWERDKHERGFSDEDKRRGAWLASEIAKLPARASRSSRSPRPIAIRASAGMTQWGLGRLAQINSELNKRAARREAQARSQA